MTTGRVRGVVGMVAVLLVLTADVGLCIDYYWNNASGGPFSTAGNWTPSGPPSSTADKAFFATNATYTVSIGTAVTNGRLSVNRGNVSFSSGSAYYYATSLQVGTQRLRQASLTVSNSRVRIGGAATDMVIGNDNVSGAVGTLNILGGARVERPGQVNIGGYNLSGVNFAAITGTVYVSGANSVLSTASNQLLYVGYGGEARLYITDGGRVDCNNFYVNQNKGPTNVFVRSIVSIGGGSGQSTLFIKNAIAIQNVGGFPNGFQYRRKPITSEFLIYTNGVFHSENSLIGVNPGATFTMAGGEIYSRVSDVRFVGSVLRGFGKLRCLSSQTRALSFRRSVGVCDWPFGAVTVTNYAVMSPGTPASPIGLLEMDGTWKGYVDFQPGCRLKFDLAGTAPTQYDRFVATNAPVYLGTYASPYTVQGGAIIDVALTNGFMPSGTMTFDLITAKDIVDTDLGLVTFNMPNQPPNGIWTASIESVAGKDVLRVTMNVPEPTGTVITIL